MMTSKYHTMHIGEKELKSSIDIVFHVSAWLL